VTTALTTVPLEGGLARWAWRWLAAGRTGRLREHGPGDEVLAEPREDGEVQQSRRRHHG
jgi:hypothetical protein